MNFEHFIASIPHNFEPKERERIRHAFLFSKTSHKGQKRKSGEDFYTHPIEAAKILGHIFPDTTTIIAMLLHDIPEDTAVSLEQIKQTFGVDVARLVDGVTKLGKVRLKNSKDSNYIENLRKMFIATSEDTRVMLIKLADRLHNMRTISALPKDKQVKIATETLEMFAPIAGRLGIGSWKDELEDLSFEVVYPKEFSETKAIRDAEVTARASSVKDMEKEVSKLLHMEGVKFLKVTGRVKRLYSLYNKLKKYEFDVSKIHDIEALRIITRSTADVYAVLGIIHKHFQPLPGRVKDFIAMPKPNGYQSLHTTIFDKSGHTLEIQIRTDLMHEEAERGIAAHWFYTESGKPDRGPFDGSFPRASWIQELRAWQDETTNPDEYLENLKIDFFHDRIFVLTPKGDVKDLPKGATVIDFAFSVHSDLGYYMMGAKINGKMCKITDELKQGDVCEILKTKKQIAVSQKWLNAARTSHARGRIRAYLSEHNKGLFTRISELNISSALPTFFRKK